MAIVSQDMELEVRKALAIPSLQARLTSDGTDDDIKLALTPTAIRQAQAADRTQRIKDLIRKGLQAEQDEEEELIFDGDDLIDHAVCAIGQIGSTTTVKKLR